MTCQNARWAVTREYISQTGFVSYYSVQTGSAHRLVAPEMIKAAKISSKLSEYAYNNNPVGTKASKNFKITSVTAKKNSETLTIKTNKKLNDTQVFAISISISMTPIFRMIKKQCLMYMSKIQRQDITIVVQHMQNRAAIRLA